MTGADYHTYVMTGDGEMQEGPHWEAIPAAAQFGLNNLTLIIDHNRFQQGATLKDTNDLAPFGPKLQAFGWDVTEIDGHSMAEIVPALERRGTRGAVMNATSPNLHDCRDAFNGTLERLAAGNARIVAVCNDSVGSSKLAGFKARWPDRLVNVGIAEQNMVGVAAGLASGGLLPFVGGASCFLTGRAPEQIKGDIAYSNANVKRVGISSGMAYGELGPTHHSIEDFAWMRVLPNLPVIAPCDAVETTAATVWPSWSKGCAAAGWTSRRWRCPAPTWPRW